MKSGIPNGLNACVTYYSMTIYVLQTKSRVKALKTSPWVNTIAEGMKRCEIKADLDGMVLDSPDFNIVTTGYVFHCCLQQINISVRISFRFLYYYYPSIDPGFYFVFHKSLFT